MKTRTLFFALLAVGLLALTAAATGAWTSKAASATGDSGLAVSHVALVVDGFDVATFSGVVIRPLSKPPSSSSGPGESPFLPRAHRPR